MQRLVFFLVANAVKTLAVAVFIFFLFYRLVGRHLQHMAAYVREQALTPQAPMLRLARPAPGGRREDDLALLARTLNELRQEILRLDLEHEARSRELRQQTSALQQELRVRTRIQDDLNLMATVFACSGEAIMLTDAQNRIVAVNDAFTRLTGYTLKEVAGRNPSLLSAQRSDPAVYREMWTALQESDFWQGELWDRRKDGQVYPKWLSVTAVRNRVNQVSNYIGIFSDITPRKQAEAKIFHLAHHDALTGLSNRMSLNLELQRAVSHANRNSDQLAVMFIDLDRFKDINDVYGHDVGDMLLLEVAGRLKFCVRESDIVARLGGDEFVVVLRDLEDPAAAARVADKIRGSLAEPYGIEEKALRTTPSIGIALFPADGVSSDALLKNADTAMYYAKSMGRNNVQFFTPGMEQAARARLQLEHDLRDALDAGQFELHYQPQVAAGDGRLVGLEALLRWRHPREGLLPSARFIPVAEETGLILRLGAWALDEACRQLGEWRARGLGDIVMAVNLSAAQLDAAGFAEEVRATLERHGVRGAHLELELTESMLMENMELNRDKLEALRQMGVRLSIDDFGTGYSSLSYLRRLPIHALKLDRSFVQDVEINPGDAAICASTIVLAHNLGLEVVAEGVETLAQRDWLLAHDCDILQGFFFSPPLPPEEAYAYMRGGSAAAPPA